MPDLNPLAFKVAIQDEATQQLNNIEKEFLKLKDKTIKVDVQGLEDLSRLMKSIGHDGSGITIKLPDLSQFMEQIKSVKATTESLFSKQNWNDIPAFTSALSQVKELSAAIDKLKHDNLAINTGNGTDFFNKLQQMGTALASAFQEVPNVKVQSMLSFMKQFEQEYQNFLDKINKRGLANFSQESQQQIERVRRQFNELNSVGGDSSALKLFQQQVRSIAAIITESIGNVIKEIGGIKTAIQHDNFSAFTTRIDNCATAINNLDAAFKKFQLTVGQDEGMKNFMMGLGEVIRNVRNTMGQIEGSKVAGKSQADIYIKNVQRMEDALYRIQEARAKVGNAIKDGDAVGFNTNGMRTYLQILDAYEKKLQNIRSNPLMMHENGWQVEALGTTFKHLIANAGDFQRSVDSYIQKQQTLETNQRRFNTMLDESEKLMNRIDAAGQKGFDLGLNTTKNDQALRQIQEFIDKLLMFDSKNLGNSHAVSELIAEYTRLKSTLGAVAKEQEKLNAAQVKENLKKDKEHFKSLDKWTESARRAGVEATKLEIQIRKLQEAETRGKLANVDTTNLSARIAELQGYINILRSIENGSKIHGHTSDFINSVPYQNSVRLANEEAAAVNKASAAKEKGAHSTRQLTEEEQRLAQAIQNSTNSAKNQSQVLSDLKGMMMQYLSVYGAQQFVTEMANITGELELQRKSLEVIIDNASTAQQLYGQIRDLSQMSPYTFQDLLKTTRQLAAFGIETKDLYNDMKALSDIGAGLNVDVSRLILAFGHTRAYGYLSGIQNRQFETAGIDLMGELVKFYNRRADEERQRGNIAEYTNRKALYGRMRKREIPFEDVQSVILGMDEPGGKFYNMQIRQFETLGGKLRNLRNNYNIMMSEMGASNHGVLTAGVSVLNELTEHWSKYATILKDILVPLGMVKVAMLALNSASSKQAAALATNVASRWRIQQMAKMDAPSGFFSGIGYGWNQKYASGSLGVPSSKDINAFKRQMGQALGAGTISKQGLKEMSLSRELPQLYRKAAGELAGLSKQQALYNSQLTGMSRSLALVRTQVTGFGARIGSFMGGMWSMIWNPATAIMAVIGAATAAVQRYQEIQRQAAAIGKSIKETAQTDINGIDQILNSYSGLVTGKKQSSVGVNGFTLTNTIIDTDELAFEGRNVADVLDELKRSLQAQSPMYEGDLFDIEQVTDNVEQVKLILNKLEAIRFAKTVELADPDSFGNAAAHTGFGNDTLFENVTDYSSAYKDLEAKIQNVNELTWQNISQSERDNIMKYGNDRQSAIREALLNNAIPLDVMSALNLPTIGKIQSRWKDIQDVSSKAIDNLVTKLSTTFKDAPEGFNVYFEDIMAKMFIEAKVDDPNVQAAIKNYFITSIQNAIRELKIPNGEQLLAQSTGALIKNTVGAEFMKRMSPKINENTTQNEFIDAYKSAISEFNVWLKSQAASPEMRDYAVKNVRMLREAAQNEFKRKTEKPAWKNELLGIDEIRHTVKTVVTGANSFDEMWDALLKKKKEAKSAVEKFNGDKNNWFQMNLGIRLQPKFENIQTILTKLREMKAAAESGAGSSAVKDAWEGGGKDLYSHLETIYGITQGQEKQGISDTDKSKNRGGSKSYKDEFAKRWDERIRIMKEAYDWYDKWEKKVGNDSAIAETVSKYQDIFNEWKTDKVLPMDFDVKEIKDYQKYVEKIRDDALKRYKSQKNDKNKNNGQEALRVYRQAVALLNDIKFDNFTRAAEQFKSLIDKAIDSLNTRWDIYNNVRETTGDQSLAFRLAGIGENEQRSRNSAEALKDDLMNRFYGMGGLDSIYNIDFDTNMDEDKIKKMFQNIIPDDMKDRIDGLVQAYKEWQKLQKQVVKSDISGYAKLIASVVSYDAQVTRIKDKLKQQKEANNALVGTNGANGQLITQADADKANSIAQTQADWQIMKMGADYANVYNNAIAMSRKEFEAATASIEGMLKKLRELGLISPDEYVSEQSKLDNARREFGTTGILGEHGAVGQFMGGGFDGLMNYYAKRRDKARQNEKNAKEGSQEQKNAKKEGDHYDHLYTSLVKLDDGAKKVYTGFQTLQSGLDLVSNLFDSLGNESMGNAMGDAAGVMGGALQGASALSALGPYGMAAGAALGLVSGLAGMHDKALERQIEKLREDVQKIENNTTLILQARERTLGFDTGDLRRTYANQYAPNERQKALWANTMWRNTYFGQGFNSKAQKDMYEYYRQNSIGTGYQQEYQNLLKQRQDYMDILDAQESKKKKSQSDIEETKSKIAELDDEIRYFSQDLAKSLFDIDIKGWADQISDALASAFENGENMAKAYGDAVTSILQSLMNKMMQMAIIEPMFQKLQDKIFGNAEKGINGIFDASDPQKSMSKVVDEIADFFGKGGDGEKTMTAAKEFMNAFQQGVQNAGLTVLNDSSSTLSNGIQGTSEETSDLLAAYVNALRQDVAINRILLTQFVAELWPSYIEQVTDGVRALNSIDQNVAFIRALLSENGALYEHISSMRTRLDNIANGVDKVVIK